MPWRVSCEIYSNCQHTCIEKLVFFFIRRGISTIRSNLRKSRQHILSRHFDICEAHPSIIRLMQCNFLSNITTFNSWHWLVRTRVSMIDNKWLDTFFFAIDNQLGHYECMIRYSSHQTGPKFSWCQRWTIKYKNLLFRIIGCSCLKTHNIWPMT